MITIRESQIKAAVIDWMFGRSMLDDAVLINEMFVANWSRRVDLAVANGKLHAFEIKSEADSLTRLPGQLDEFSRRFDKITVVAAPKFVDEVIASYPTEVGVFEVISAPTGLLSLKQVRPGRLVENRNAALLTDFLNKSQVARMLRTHGIQAEPGEPRLDLIAKTSAMPISAVRAFVLDSIKGKYARTFAAFCEQRASAGTAQSLSALSKAKLERSLRSSVPVVDVEAEESVSRRVKLDPRGRIPANEWPAGAPRWVLARRPSAKKLTVDD